MSKELKRLVSHALQQCGYDRVIKIMFFDTMPVVTVCHDDLDATPIIAYRVDGEKIAELRF
jgi:hypothetical protein